MKFQLQRTITLALLIMTFTMTGCEKYLEEPSDRSLAVITSLDDLQALIDNYGIMNYAGARSQEVSADDYYITDADYASLLYEYDQKMYTWQKENVFAPGNSGNDWLRLYKTIYYANTIQEKLKTLNITASNQIRWNNIKGQSLVFRAVSFLDVAQLWSQVYQRDKASTDLGIPLRLEPDFNLPSSRSNLKETYDQITKDLLEAIPLLPNTQTSVLRPTKAAAFGLLSRTYLWMGEYAKAGLYADSCLQLNNQLMNFNILNSSDAYPIKSLNVEVIFDRAAALGDVISIGRTKIPEALYLSYGANDLRKSIYFRRNSDASFGFKGYYTGYGALFTGISVDEMYLNRAECFARENDASNAISDLNTLLIKRWKTNEYTPYIATTPDEALKVILAERRKELLMRGTRWMDIKRLNKEGANIILSRFVNNKVYSLLPNDVGFALPIPDDLATYY